MQIGTAESIEPHRAGSYRGVSRMMQQQLLPACAPSAGSDFCVSSTRSGCSRRTASLRQRADSPTANAVAAIEVVRKPQAVGQGCRTRQMRLWGLLRRERTSAWDSPVSSAVRSHHLTAFNQIAGPAARSSWRSRLRPAANRSAPGCAATARKEWVQLIDQIRHRQGENAE